VEDFGFSVRSGTKYFILRYGLGFIINFIGTIVIVRIGGARLWGIFAISQLVLAIFAFLSLGCWGYLIQNKKEPTYEEIGNCYSFQSLLSIAWALIVIALTPFLSSYFSSKELTLLLLGTILGGFTYGWRYIACGLSERKLLYRVAAMSEVSDLLIFNGVAISLALMGYPFYGLLIGSVLRGVGSTLVALISAGQRIIFSFDRVIMNRIGRFSLNFISYNILQWLPINAGPVVAGAFLSLQDLGLLQLSYKTAEYSRVLVTISSRLSLSVFSHLGRSGIELQKRMKKAIDLLLFLLIPGLGLVVALSPMWIPFIYGDPWVRMSNVMMIIVFPFLTMAMMSLICSLLSSQGMVRGPFLFFGIYNIIYWPILVILTKKMDYLGLPVTEWVVLMSCAILIRELRKGGLSLGMVYQYLLKLLGVTFVITCIGFIAIHKYATIGIVLSIIASTLWFVISPVRREVKNWITGYPAPLAKRETVSSKSTE